MALIKTYKGLSPKWGRDCYFSENATLVGDVTLGDECSVWFNAVVRGDVAPITIGERSNVQDGNILPLPVMSTEKVVSGCGRWRKRGLEYFSAPQHL